MERVEQFTGEAFVFLKPVKGTPIALQDTAALPPGASAQPGGFPLGFEVADVEAALAEWRAKGADVLSDITDMGAGRMFVVRDPEGNLLSIAQLYDSVRAMREQLGL